MLIHYWMLFFLQTLRQKDLVKGNYFQNGQAYSIRFKVCGEVHSFTPSYGDQKPNDVGRLTVYHGNCRCSSPQQYLATPAEREAVAAQIQAMKEQKRKPKPRKSLPTPAPSSPAQASSLFSLPRAQDYDNNLYGSVRATGKVVETKTDCNASSSYSTPTSMKTNYPPATPKTGNASSESVRYHPYRNDSEAMVKGKAKKKLRNYVPDIDLTLDSD